MLANAPLIDLINLLFCAGFWIGPMAAVWLYRRFSSAPTIGQAAIIGVLAGAWHGIIGVALSPLGLAGAGGLLADTRSIVPVEGVADFETGLTGVGGLLFNLIGIAVDLAFGLIGGLIGGAIFRPRPAIA